MIIITAPKNHYVFFKGEKYLVVGNGIYLHVSWEDKDYFIANGNRININEIVYSVDYLRSLGLRADAIYISRFEPSSQNGIEIFCQNLNLNAIKKNVPHSIYDGDNIAYVLCRLVCDNKYSINHDFVIIENYLYVIEVTDAYAAADPILAFMNRAYEDFARYGTAVMFIGRSFNTKPICGFIYATDERIAELKDAIRGL